MIIGRAIYGIGGDSITASQWALILSYFHSQEVGIANVFISFFSFDSMKGIVYFSTSIGSALNLSLSP